jgi:hypothetical protein
MYLPEEYSILLPEQRGSAGVATRLIQEWLCLHGYSVRIDGDYGPATEAAVRRFQTREELFHTGVVDETTFRKLIMPMTRACKTPPTTGETLSARVVAAARQHLKQHPREVGGINAGPWVRLYTRGKQGPDYPWCAGFACTMLEQAREKQRRLPQPLPFTLSCDELARAAQEVDRFIEGASITDVHERREKIVPGTLFLVRNPVRRNDWIHVGIVTAVHAEYMETIEGNTNDEGDREGYEVCKRLRGYAGKDFILV